MLTIFLYIQLSAHASGTTGGSAVITGLPFTSASRHSAISVGYFGSFNANQTWVGGTVEPSTAEILLRHLSSADDGVSSMDYDNNLKVNSAIIITGNYTIN